MKAMQDLRSRQRLDDEEDEVWQKEKKAAYAEAEAKKEQKRHEAQHRKQWRLVNAQHSLHPLV